ncbi:hypothetical protein QFZ36_003930 [Pseudarthrobacter siccitolerans]|uniref:FHA domain-containing protein n=1 Tax=Pseudarthrobacter siccitolerans TaxID=861266 RepID=A0ABU0PSY1_9MICC|nr:FHA domain-containing protein [Pseudarthrobacter siccitolerans]MDQ0676369.1 hypothetical protein [Pseudarthrobacter siccitolerans]
MTAVSYIAGTWLGIVRSHTAVLLGPGTQPALIAALWDLLESRPEVHEVLHAVTSSSGGSLANIPSFGILDFQGPLRVFLRGDLDVTVQSTDGPVELNGRDVTTWTERRLNNPGLCRLAIPYAGSGVHRQATPAQADAYLPSPGQPEADLPELPLAEGVVLLQSLVLMLDAGTRAAIRHDLAAAGTAVSAKPAAATAPTVIETTSPAAVASAVSASAIEAPGQAGDLPEITVAPEHGASAETVYAVIDEDFGVEGSAVPDADPGTNAARETDADAGTDPAPETDAAPRFEPEPEPVRENAGSGSGEQAPASEMTSSYDHLWERTVVRRIEDAAIREDLDEAGPESGNQEAADQEAGNQETPGPESPDKREEAASPAEPGSPEALPAPADAQPVVVLDVQPAVVPAAPSTGSPSPAPVAPTSSGLIDSVPWRTGGAGSGQAPTVAAPSPMLSAVPSAGSDSPVTPAAQTSAEYDGDHDGQTVMKGSLAGMAARPVRAVKDVSAAVGPLVLARLCAQDHPNPPTSAACATCGAGLLPDAVQVARPRLGRMRISTGELVDLDQSLVIGRQPSVSRVQGGVMPRLVQVASPGGDISRSHVEVRLEGWHVMLCDLKATNGTVLVREGQPPRRLAQNEMAILLDGDIAELGDNISLRFEEIL